MMDTQHCTGAFPEKLWPRLGHKNTFLNLNYNKDNYDGSFLFSIFFFLQDRENGLILNRYYYKLVNCIFII